MSDESAMEVNSPACWVNVYDADQYAYSTKERADQAAGSARIACIPVYLPGEGAVDESKAAAEIERLTETVDRFAHDLARVQEKLAERAEELVQALKERDEARRLHTQLSEAYANCKCPEVDARFTTMEVNLDEARHERDEARKIANAKFTELVKHQGMISVYEDVVGILVAAVSKKAGA